MAWAAVPALWWWVPRVTAEGPVPEASSGADTPSRGSELMFSLMASVRLSTGGRGLYNAQWDDAKLSTHVNIPTAAELATSQCTKSSQACWSEQQRQTHTHIHAFRTSQWVHTKTTEQPRATDLQCYGCALKAFLSTEFFLKKIWCQCSKISWIRISFHMNTIF